MRLKALNHITGSQYVEILKFIVIFEGLKLTIP